MAKVEIKMGEIGGGGSVSYLTDKSNLLGSITSKDDVFTATQDCVMVGTVTGGTNFYAIVYINETSTTRDGPTANTLFNVENGKSMTIGHNSSNTGVPITKGTVVSVRNTNATPTYDLKFYSCV